MYFDRFDICTAYYLFGSLYHSGQGSLEYAYLGRALKCGFKPGAIFGMQSLSDNAREIYRNLQVKRVEACGGCGFDHGYEPEEAREAHSCTGMCDNRCEKCNEWD